MGYLTGLFIALLFCFVFLFLTVIRGSEDEEFIFQLLVFTGIAIVIVISAIVCVGLSRDLRGIPPELDNLCYEDMGILQNGNYKIAIRMTNEEFAKFCLEEVNND